VIDSRASHPCVLEDDLVPGVLLADVLDDISDLSRREFLILLIQDALGVEFEEKVVVRGQGLHAAVAGVRPELVVAHRRLNCSGAWD
jgi:hypothetical protein